MLRRLQTIIIGILLLCSFSIAQADDLSPFSGQKGLLKIAGGTAHIPVMKEAAKLIMQANPDIRITIAGGGSGVGIKQVGEGMINIGNAGRMASEKEIKSYGLEIFKWATDGVSAVANPKNQVSNLSSEQLQDIFAGKIDNWKMVGGIDKAINLYVRDTASGTRSVFWKKALKKGPVSTRANVVVSNGAMKTAIGGDPYGIGYVSVGHIDSSVQAVAIDGVVANLKNVQNGKYKVARGLYSLTVGKPPGLAQLFLNFLYSPTGQNIVVSKGFVAVR
ncbi:phosphate ABC transporter substrate-binding protein [Desulfotalea psychrophila]|uniref:Related to phosphate ABC transporter, periplasmic substrate binding protein n=1 Tax=Desulfotalea psychrophila (strain LSv54 / DSM 12343) TaxID=177439 RepID=Q6ANW3_DESPS|nr:phosphate ABC transporter substrate-binding protein [Desulfotalea psychrophila]CAG35961.1 related to phosphate ABC transporter, periplasmic substrate binding protein [Desulfotalea psychrophila LSv54]